MLFGLMQNFERIPRFFARFLRFRVFEKPIFFARICGARDALVLAVVGEDRDEYMCSV